MMGKVITLAVLFVLALAFMGTLSLSGLDAPSQDSSGPLALVVASGLATPSYHDPIADWQRIGHRDYVRGNGFDDCLGCHYPPEHCNQCHTYVGGAPIIPTMTPNPAATMTPTPVEQSGVPKGSVITILVDEQRKRWMAVLPDAYADLTPPFSLADEDAISQGRVRYMSDGCALCHGPKGDGQGAFSQGLDPKPIDFTDAALMSRLSNDYLFWRLSEGGTDAPFLSSMPSWKNMFTEDERWQLVAFLRSKIPMEELLAAKAQEESSKQLGLQMLLANGCMGCHMYDDLGGTVGPQLDDVGSRIDAEQIRQSIVDPTAVLTEGFTDLMPQDYGEKISAEDLDILVNFLAGP